LLASAVAAPANYVTTATIVARAITLAAFHNGNFHHGGWLLPASDADVTRRTAAKPR
jgi:hypothetical protein